MTTRAHRSPEYELVYSAQQGSLEAFTKLYETNFPMVYRRVHYLVPAEDVEDVTQEVFLAAMRSLKTFRGEAKFSTWLRTITNRQVADYYRRKRPATAELDDEILAPLDPTTGEEAILLRQTMRELPQKYQEVLLLRFADELPFEEIGIQLGCSLEAAKSLFRRAVSALQIQAVSDD